VVGRPTTSPVAVEYFAGAVIEQTAGPGAAIDRRTRSAIEQSAGPGQPRPGALAPIT
jgi:hypothetical protein